MNPPIGSPGSFRSNAGEVPPRVSSRHYRNPSTSSSISNLSIGSVASALSAQSAPEPHRGFDPFAADLPPGSKMAQDARRAMRMVQKGLPIDVKGKGRADVPLASPKPTSPLRSPLLDVDEDPFEYRGHQSAYDAADFINEVANGTENSQAQAAFEALELALESGRMGDLFPPPPPIGEDRDRTPQPGHPGPPPTAPLPLLPAEAANPPLPPLPPQYLKLPVNPGPMISGRAEYDPGTGAERLAKRRDNMFSEVAREQNAVGISWAGLGHQKFALITDLKVTRSHNQARYFDFAVAPSGVQVVEVPPSWAGRVQKITGHEDDPATWAELTFDGYKGMTFFNVSYAHGNNGPVTVRDDDGGPIAGCKLKARDVAPAEIMVRDSGGHWVVCGTDKGPGHLRTKARQFYREFLSHPSLGTTDVDDHTGVIATHGRHLALDFH